MYYLSNAPTPYKIAFWEELGTYCDLTVLLEVSNSRERDKSWKSENRDNYKEIVMPYLFRRIDDALCLNVRKYLKRRDGIVVINGYNTPTGIYAILYSKFHKLPYIISCDGGLLKDDKPLTKIIKRYLLTGAGGYLSSGKTTDEYLIQYGAERSKIAHYPFTSVKRNQILERPLTHEEKVSVRGKLGISERQMIISVGQFIHRKGFDVLLNAINGLDKDIGVYIIGGMPPEEYQRIVEKNDLTSVHFLPFMQSDILKKYYLAADLFVFPTREDIWGLVVNEAMAYGLPVITTTRCVSGVEMIQHGDTGKLVDPDDVDGLHDAMQGLLRDKGLMQWLSSNALNRAKEYTIEEMAKKTAEYLRTVSI